MSYVSVGLTIAGGLMQANGLRQQGAVTAQQAALQAQQGKYQAGIEESNSLESARLIRKAGARTQSSAVAGYAASGVQVGEGSAGETEKEIGQNVEHDAFQTLLDGSRRAGALRAGATVTANDGLVRQAAANVAASNALFSAGSSAFSTGWRTGRSSPGSL